MKRKRFKAKLEAGHKEDAIEVPFDPEKVWEIPAKAQLRGRRGHRVQGSLNGFQFDSVVIPRSGKFLLLIERDTQKAAGVAVGDIVDTVIGPFAE